jgi:SRSO17 transposase
MTHYIVKRWPRFDNFVALFSANLTRPAQRHLIALLIALIIYDGRKNLAGLNRALWGPCHKSSLNRFVSEGTWSACHFEQLRLDYLNRQVRGYLAAHRAKGQSVNAFLCIDDTNNPKTGECANGTAYQYSHLAGGLIRCYCLVTAVVVIGPFVLPLSFQLYRPKPKGSASGDDPSLGQYPSKIELAVRLIQEWQPPQGTQPFVLADSWYVCDELFEAAHKRNFTLIGGLKANRRITTSACENLTALSLYAPSVPKSAYQLVTLGKQRFELAGIEAKLKGGRAVKLVISRSLAAGAKPKAGIKPYTYRYFVSSEAGLALKTLIELYQVRWEIETFHAHLKQLLGLDHNQCWLPRSIERMWALLLMAYSYLMLEAVEHSADYLRPGQVRVGLGQVVAHHKHQAHLAQAHWIYDQTSAGQSLEAILAQIAV